MKYKLILIASILFLTFGAVQSVTAQWVQTNATESDGGYICCFAANGTNIFAATSRGGLFFSTDNGGSWTTAKNGLPKNTYFFSLAAINTNLFAGSFFGGVSLSTDKGTSWKTVNTGLANDSVLALAVIGTNLFAGTYGGGVSLSTNNGTSWTTVNTGLTNDTVRVLTVSGTTLYAGTLNGVFRSDGNGASWTSVGLTGHSVFAIVMDDTNLFALVSASGGDADLLHSSDAGSSWVRLGGNENGWLAMSGPNLFWGGKDGIFLTSDMFRSGKTVSTGLTAQVTSLAISGSNLFAGSDSGVWRRPLSEMIGSSDVFVPAQTPSTVTSYPNPVHEKTTIGYTVVTAGMVSIEVFDALSKSVAILVHETMQPGGHETTFDTRALPEGVYYYRLDEGGVVETKKLLIVR